MSTDKQYPRIIFLGTPDFAVATLKALVENNFNVVAVVTAPDKPAGRGMQLKASAVKEYALTQQIPVLQPEKLRSKAFLAELAGYKADSAGGGGLPYAARSSMGYATYGDGKCTRFFIAAVPGCCADQLGYY